MSDESEHTQLLLHEQRIHAIEDEIKGVRVRLHTLEQSPTIVGLRLQEIELRLDQQDEMASSQKVLLERIDSRLSGTDDKPGLVSRVAALETVNRTVIWLVGIAATASIVAIVGAFWKVLFKS